MPANFTGLRSDTLSFDIQGNVRMHDCQISNLSAQAIDIRFQSGKVDNLHLNLDFLRGWTVNVDSFHIDTEHLSSSLVSYCYLQKGECRRLKWKPTGKNGELNIQLKEETELECR